MQTCKKQNNDYLINEFVFDADALKQVLESRCKVLKGELPYSPQLGVTLNMTKDLLDMSILEIIRKTVNVKSCTLQQSSLINRQYTAKFLVTSTLGTFTLQI